MTRRGPVRPSDPASPAADDARRVLLLDLYRTALAAVDGRRCVANALAGSAAVDTAVIAVGKAAAAMMAGAQEVLGAHLRCGFVVTAPGTASVLPADARVQVHVGDHPVPGHASLAAGAALLEFVADLPPDLPIWVLVSGGASSLIEVPLPGVTLADLETLNQWALAHNVPIGQLNGVRRRLSAVKGGRLAARLAGRSAQALLISDVPDDDPSVIGSGLIACRAGDDAPWPADLPVRLRSMLETLPAPPGATLPSTIVASLSHAMAAVEARAHALGLRVQRRGQRLEGLAVSAAADLSESLLHLTADVLLAGGETTVELPAVPGVGGRCQHLALAAAQRLQGHPDVLLLVAGTDGVDGASVDAGALVDGDTVARAALDGEDAADCLRRADAGRCLQASGDLLHTGPTLTNVGDVVIGLKMTADRARALAA
jgi:glycerate 2-kinase